jgi:hypothetical protein
MITGSVAVTSYAQQPPDLVASDKNGNTAMGTDALVSLPPGPPASGNTAAGFQALALNSNGDGNTAVGQYALSSNTFGFLNTAVGVKALSANTSSGENTAIGWAALADNTTGSDNTACGSQALSLNSTGHDNTASGLAVLVNNKIGSYNSSLGVNSLFANETGSYNAALGYQALASNHGGSNNIAVGTNAGLNVRGGNYNIEIGNVGTANDVGAIRIGTSSQQGSAYIAGVANSHVAGSAVYITSTGQLGVLASSERYKTDVASMGSSSEKVRELRPVTFHLKTDPKAGRQYGLIAEEVAKVYPELVIRGDKRQIEGVRYEELTPMLLNELQQQQARVADQQSRLESQQAELQDLRSQLADLRRAMQERTH